MQLNMSRPMIYLGKMLQPDNKEKTLVMTCTRAFLAKTMTHSHHIMRICFLKSPYLDHWLEHFAKLQHDS
jgi:mevalonate pyrophosphate decarboxylase